MIIAEVDKVQVRQIVDSITFIRKLVGLRLIARREIAALFHLLLLLQTDAKAIRNFCMQIEWKMLLPF